MKQTAYYVNENWPTSNSKPGVFYILCFRDMKRRHYYTVDDLQNAIAQAKHQGHKITRAVRMCNGSAQTFIPETRAEQEKRHNENRVESIALELECYINGVYYRCPECGETVSFPDGVGDKYRCPHCKYTADISIYEPLSLWDYLQDVYDVEYYIGGDRELRGVRLMVACGGPNIYIDSKRRKVELYWWTDYAEWPLYSEVCDELNQLAEEFWGCC